MKSIYLLRHAKSSWDDPSMEDIHRSINKRGQRAAKLMCDYFRDQGIHPAMVMCSPATRTRQTLEALKPVLREAPVTFEPRVYEATRQTLLARLNELPNSAASVLLIGHNPGLERLATHLIDETAEGPAVTRLHEKYPTGTLAVLRAPIETWIELKAGICQLESFIRPSDLETQTERA
jgi:phosphohistidine phosphatase